MLPSRSSKIESTRLLDSPSADVNVSRLSHRQRTSPPAVAIHSAPSRSRYNALTRLLGSVIVDVCPSPSTWRSPSRVPMNMSPPGVIAIEVIFDGTGPVGLFLGLNSL